MPEPSPCAQRIAVGSIALSAVAGALWLLIIGIYDHDIIFWVLIFALFVRCVCVSDGGRDDSARSNQETEYFNQNLRRLNPRVYRVEDELLRHGDGGKLIFFNVLSLWNRRVMSLAGDRFL